MDRPLHHFPEPAEFIEVFIMPPTEVAAPVFVPTHAPTFTQAAVRFVVSFAALIGLSLLLAAL
ncbi:hypothetical protein KBI52_13710 [Microvirga sp. HBU67558]|uniref:hypothetical protein n=1 Tax=Microvirga TaxID=186650 RepID=UPI001B361539|nr:MULTISPECIES: hypothetical protein [unclassified Microvirga]MBQ0821257.1 hypothetical protein [Microvirga sp. HBU67558]